VPGLPRPTALTRIGRAWRIVLVAALTLIVPPGSLALSTAAVSERVAGIAASDWPAIRGIIGDQLSALRSGDAARAYSFASNGIQLQFHDAPTFLRMVRGSYSQLLEARYTEFLEGAVVDGHVIQPLRLVLEDDTVLVALYEMVQEDTGAWRIGGCVLAPSTVRST
jgi:hypothetical protein